MKELLLVVRAIVPGLAQHQILALVYELLSDGVDGVGERGVFFHPAPELILSEPLGVADGVLVEVVHRQFLQVAHLLGRLVHEVFFEAVQLPDYLVANQLLPFGYGFSHDVNYTTFRAASQ